MKDSPIKIVMEKLSSARSEASSLSEQLATAKHDAEVQHKENLKLQKVTVQDSDCLRTVMSAFMVEGLPRMAPVCGSVMLQHSLQAVHKRTTVCTAFTAELEVVEHCTAFLQMACFVPHLQLGSVLVILYKSVHVSRLSAWHDITQRLSLHFKLLQSMHMHTARILGGFACDARPAMRDSRLSIKADLCACRA